MSDQLDDRIRELFTEADRATPEPPTMPTDVPVPFPWRRLVLAPALGAFLLTGVLAILNATGFGFDVFGAAADSADGIVDAAPADDYVLALADLNLACSDFANSVERPPQLSIASSYSTLSAIDRSFEDLALVIREAANAFPGDEAVQQALARAAFISTGLDEAVALGRAGAPDRLESVLVEIELLGAELEAAGAVDCATIP